MFWADCFGKMVQIRMQSSEIGSRVRRGERVKFVPLFFFSFLILF